MITMAERKLITFIDDVDGKSEATGTHRIFDRHGRPYEIDLNEAHRADLSALWDQMESLCALGRKLSGPGGKTLKAVPNFRTARAEASTEPATIRAWCAENTELLAAKGLMMPSARGRIHGAIRELWESVANARLDEYVAPKALEVPKPSAPPVASFSAAKEAPAASRRPTTRTRKATPAPDKAAVASLVTEPMTNPSAGTRKAKRGNL
jgi:hypothetical protein